MNNPEIILLLCEPTRHNSSVFVGHFHKAVYEVKINIERYDVSAYAFGDIGIYFAVVKNAVFVVFFEGGAVGITPSPVYWDFALSGISPYPK